MKLEADQRNDEREKRKYLEIFHKKRGRIEIRRVSVVLRYRVVEIVIDRFSFALSSFYEKDVLIPQRDLKYMLVKYRSYDWK